MTTDVSVCALSEEDATLILFAGVARSHYYNGLARPANLFVYIRRGLAMHWLPEDLREHVRAYPDNMSKFFLTLAALRKSGLIADHGSGYAMTEKGAAAVEELLRARNYNLDHLTYYVGSRSRAMESRAQI